MLDRVAALITRERVRLVLLVTLLTLAACSSGDVDGGPEASCPALLDYGGHRYVGQGDLMRAPPTTGRLGTGWLPSCDDGNGASGDEPVGVEELRDITMEQALLVNGRLFVRDGEPLPAVARPWFVRQTCVTAGTFELAGTWLGVRTPSEPRFDGDLRAPYTLEVRVTTGPAEYVDATVLLRATARTRPALGPRDVKGSLWTGGTVTARVHCEGRRFVAEGLRATRG